MLGSSSSSTLGLAISARPMASICCSPPLMVPASCVRRSFRRGKMVKTLSMSASISGLSSRTKAPICRFSVMVMRAKTPRPSGTITRPCLTSSHAPWPLMLRPMNSISPSATIWMPVMAFSVVVLPAPLAPMRLTSSPWWTSKLTPLTAWIPP